MKIDLFIKYACSNCGLCFKSDKKINFKKNIISKLNDKQFKNYCPGIGINRNKITLDTKNNTALFGNLVSNYVGYTKNKTQREISSSGGVLTEIVCYLLENKIVNAVCIPMPTDETEVNHTYKFCTLKNLKEIRKYAQSIYTKIPAYGVVEKIKKFNGKLAFIGLPDQISSLRVISFEQNFQNKIKFFLGPMVGILMDKEVINMVKILSSSRNKILKLRWRYGEWPGKLLVKFKDKELSIDNFYYNYLLPFFCSNESLVQDDFYNELADISIGDAWLPEYENIGKGWSLIQSKTYKGDRLLKEMNEKKKISLEKIDDRKALRMHEHMIDFKKRGSKYRKKILNIFSIPTPKDYGFELKYSYIRYLIELFILIVILICKTKLARYLMSKINQKILGLLFSKLRIIWKALTKNIKRKGLYDNF